MAHIDIPALVAKAVAAENADRFAGRSDRAVTVTGSEVGTCARKTVYRLRGEAPDADYEDDGADGAATRGHDLELGQARRLKAGLDKLGIDLLFSGADDAGQIGLNADCQSATPDGLFVSRDGSAFHVTGIHWKTGEIVTLYGKKAQYEHKSMDPRAYEALVAKEKCKPAHPYQVIQGMDLFRRTTDHQPDFGILVYQNASFSAQQTTFLVPWDEQFAEAVRSRAAVIKQHVSDGTLPIAEGRLRGGKDCKYCPYEGTCRAHEAGEMPREDRDEQVASEARSQIAQLVAARDEAKSEMEAYEATRKACEAEILDLIKGLGSKRVKLPGGGSVSVSVQTRMRLDKEAAKAAGVDLSQFEVPGKEFPVLKVTAAKR